MRWVKRQNNEAYLRVDKWFAWYPVSVGGATRYRAWLERVWRKREYAQNRRRASKTIYEYINLEEQFHDN